MRKILLFLLALFPAIAFGQYFGPIYVPSHVAITGGTISGLTSPLPVASGGTNAATASGTSLDNITGFSSTGFISRAGAGAYSFAASTGTGSVVLSNGASLTAPNLDTPTAITLTNGTGLPISTGLTGAGTGVLTALGQAVTGSGGIVLSTSPTLTTPNLGTPSAVTLTNGTGLPISTGVSGLGTGVATALGQAVTGSGGMVQKTSPAIATPTITGAIPSYNSITTAGAGMCVIVADTRNTYINQGANFGPSTVYAVPSGQDGRYTVSMTTGVTTVASGGTPSSTLPNTTVSATDSFTGASVSANIGATSTGNTLSTWGQGHTQLQAKGATNITVQTNGYASAGTTAMQYYVRYVVQYCGN